jgi:hypothetical protein
MAYALALASSGCAFAAVSAQAQEPHDTDPAAALADALTAACRANETEFAKSLTADNAAAFGRLPPAQRKMLLQRFSLSSEPGKPLRSSDQNGRTVLRCESSGGIAEFRFGEPRVRENLAFVPVTVVDGASANFGMIQEGGGWKLLSLGLLMLNIPELSKQWSDQDMSSREGAAAAALRELAAALGSYRRLFGNLPDSLAQLGPAPKEEVSPERASLVSATLAAGDEGGYSFRYRMLSAPDSAVPLFELAAAPDSYGKSGRRSFFRDTDGNLHAADKKGGPAGSEDPLLPADQAPQ